MATSSESGAQLFSRLGVRRRAKGLDAVIFPEEFPKPCDVYELYGDEGCGKSEILLHLVVRSVVPTEWKGVKLNGLGIGVIFIDTDYKFCMLRLSSILESYIGKSLTTNDQDVQLSKDLEDIVKASLKNFWLVRCSSSEQLLMTIHSLDSFIGYKFDVSILMLDSVSSFYWIDKLKCGDNRKMLEQSHARLVASLEKLVNTYNLVLFATKSAIIRKRVENLGSVSPASPSFSMVQHRSTLTDHFELLSNVWTKFVKYRWLLSVSDQNEVSSNESGNRRLSFTDKVNTLGLKYFRICQNGVNFTDV
ncbi:DNA repair protein XRCC2-like [Lineus longissimus]|uniref:DNA repair protein XRCC2-like n=1 Tax=Lineus longissimus TaxID=88925 RepID=UPI00315C9519